MSDFTDSVEAAFESAGTDAATAADAAERLANFREDHDEELSAEAVAERLEAAPYDDFAHAYDWLVGDLAAGNEDCTDTREYRLAGYDDFAADPQRA